MLLLCHSQNLSLRYASSRAHRIPTFPISCGKYVFLTGHFQTGNNQTLEVRLRSCMRRSLDRNHPLLCLKEGAEAQNGLYIYSLSSALFSAGRVHVGPDPFPHPFWASTQPPGALCIGLALGPSNYSHLLIAHMLLGGVLGPNNLRCPDHSLKEHGLGTARCCGQIQIGFWGRRRLQVKYCVLCWLWVQGRDPGMLYSLVEV